MGHFHLMINHMPVVGTLFGVVLLAFGLKREGADLKLAAFWTFMFVTVVAAATYFTGDSAEEMLKHVPGVDGKALEKFIAPHEEAALVFLIAISVAGVLSAVAMVSHGKKNIVSPALLKILMAVSVVALLLAFRTAQLGGQIRHSEVRSASIGAVEKAEAEEFEYMDADENGMPDRANR
ncbi:MAG: hypothetical protein HY098_04075 [Nitrospinae bacterium]|nr:hypothetical protein [Nitrospinota bacterium]